jgi:hypothetical protein
MTNLPIIHNVPFNQMTDREQYELVRKTFRAALTEIETVQDKATRKELRDRLDKALTKGTALSQHAAIMTVRLVVRSIQRQAEATPVVS